MKHLITTIAIFLLAGGIASAQRTNESPGTISYQGLVSSRDGAPLADGEYPVTVTLYADVEGRVEVWQDTYATSVHGGVFNMYLGSGKVPLPAPSLMDRALWIGTRIAGGEEMRPLTRLSSSPYAINVPDNAITTNKLADGAVTADKMSLDYLSGVSVNGKKIPINGKVLNIQAGKDIEIRYDEISQSLVIGSPEDRTTGQGKEEGKRTILATPQDAWTMQGNGVKVPGATPVGPANNDFIGTLGVVNFNIRVNNTQIMSYQQTVPGATPNVVGGHGGNNVGPNAIGNVIAGGGDIGSVNTIAGDRFNVISGGLDNSILNSGSFGGVIAGGQSNQIGTAAAVTNYGTISGGLENQVTATYGTIGGGKASIVSAVHGTVGGGIGNNVSGALGTIAGGDGNQLGGEDASIGGGYHNQIVVGADYGTIAGGRTDSILNGSSRYGTIGGGEHNVIGTASIAATHATIGGGQGNLVTANHSFVGGGQTNSISALWGVVGGGFTNQIVGPYGVIGGGASNSVLNAASAFGTIGGGQSNQIGTAAAVTNYATIAGGYLNQVTATYGTIAGGKSSIVSAVHGSVGGGIGNSVSGALGTIAGGDGNQLGGADGSIGGGYHNQIATGADYGTIAGGGNDSILNGSSRYGTIGGGEHNVIGTASIAATHATIGGGQTNSITAAWGVVSGGFTNQIFGPYGVIGGGASNSVLNAASAFGTIGGGQSNQIGTAAAVTNYATIAGGYLNQVTATYGTIAGGKSSIVSAVHGSVGGGIGNSVSGALGTIAGGDGNQLSTSDASIGGGYHNKIISNGLAATIPGGENLTAQSYGQTVVGVLNIPKGAMTPGGAPNDEPIFIVGNGIQGSQSNAFEVSYNGHSTVFQNTGGAVPVVHGATYVDNIIYAWGNVDQDGKSICEFGVDKITHLGAGWYQVMMKLIDPNGNPVQLNCGSVTATISSKNKPGDGWSDVCRHIGVSQIENNVFDIYISDKDCKAVDEFFTFKVTGRP